MINTINTPSNLSQSPDMWQYPPGTDEVARDITEMQQRHYVDAIAAPDTESRAVEGGIPLTPVREGGAFIEAEDSLEYGAVYATGSEVVVPETAETKIAIAQQDVDAEFAAMPEAQAARSRQEHDNAANAQVKIYAPRLEQMRDLALEKDKYELAA